MVLRSFFAAAALVGFAFAAPFASRSTSSPFPYGSTPVRGVSLGSFEGFLFLPNNGILTFGFFVGGWLVLEPWITPSLFDNTRK